jgi:hypothetical protein
VPSVRSRRQSSLHHRIALSARVEPFKKGFRFVRKARGGRRFKVNLFALHRTRHYLHRAAAVVAPAASLDLAQATLAGRKKRCMPAKQPRGGKRIIILARCVQHHFDHAFHVSVRRYQRPDIHAKPARNRRTHLLGVQTLAFDFAAFDHI